MTPYARLRGLARDARLHAVVGLVLLALLLYANNLGNALVYDDNEAIVNNPAAHGLQQVGRIWTTPSWWPPDAGAVHYRPLPTLSFAANYSAHGLSPSGYHLLNNVIHGVVSALVFLVLVASGVATVPALLAAVLFLAHPIHVEAVSWGVGRADLLAAGFLFAGLLAHIHAIRAVGRRRAVLVVGGWAGTVCAGLSKESGFMAPLIVLAWDSIMLDGMNPRRAWRRIRAAAWLEYLGYAAILLGFWVLRSVMVGGATTATVTEMASPLGDAGFVDRLLTGSYVLARYIALLVWPTALSVDYSPDEITRVTSWLDPRALLGLATWVGIAVAIGVSARWSRISCFALIAGLLYFVPSSNIPFAVGTIMSDRQMYVPVLALCVPLAFGLWSLRPLVGRPVRGGRPRFTRLDLTTTGPPHPTLSRVRGGEGKAPHPTLTTTRVGVAAWLPIGLAAFIVLAYGVRTVVRNADWKDELTLFQAAYAVAPRSAMSNKNLASALSQQGRNQEAIPLALTAVEILPRFPDAHLVLANAYFLTGRYAEAVPEYEATLALVPQHATALLNLGAAFQVTERYGQALAAFDAALELNPNLDLAWFNRVHALVALGRIDEADRTLIEAGRRYPNHRAEPEARQKVQRARAGLS